MKKAFLLFGTGLLLMGCASDASKDAAQTPRFGEPQSTIPWNQPTDWERSGQLGSMPGFQPSR
jgi:outer membrane biogenesis lipoprotein LolB